MLFVSQIGRVLYILAVKMSMFIYLEVWKGVKIYLYSCFPCYKKESINMRYESIRDYLVNLNSEARKKSVLEFGSDILPKFRKI